MEFKLDINEEWVARIQDELGTDGVPLESQMLAAIQRVTLQSELNKQIEREKQRYQAVVQQLTAAKEAELEG